MREKHHPYKVLILPVVIIVLLLLGCIPAVNTFINLPYCRWQYSRHQSYLTSQIPEMLDHADGEYLLLLAMDRSAHIIQHEEFTAADLSLSSYGDLYRHTYTYGLVWTDHPEALLQHNSGLTLYPLADAGWYAYALISSQ